MSNMALTPLASYDKHMPHVTYCLSVFLVVILPLALGAPGAVACQIAERERVEILGAMCDLEIQNAIDGFVSKWAPVTAPSPEEMEQAQEDRNSLIRAFPELAAMLVPELLIAQEKYNDEKKAWMAVYLLDVAAQRASKLDTIRAITPYLDSRHPHAKGALYEMLDEYSPNGTSDRFALLKVLIRQDMGRLHPNLVEYMYETSPSDALLFMLRTRPKPASREDKKAFIWAAHVVDEYLWKLRYGDLFLREGEVDSAALDEIASSVERPEWWARLYAATIMRNHLELRQENLIKTLLEDSHELVRRMASEI